MKDLNISVVIPNYNGVHLFPDTLPALIKALENSGRAYEIIIADDCSTDDSVNYIQEHFPQVELLTGDKNSGFSKTINKGIYAASKELVLLLNSDVKLSENYFADQLPYFTLPDTFGVMGKIIGWDDDLVQDGLKYPKFEGFKLKTSMNYLPESNTSPNYTMYLSGANALVARAKLLKLSGFNELFTPFYIEDVDLSTRAWRLGWKCYFEPSSICRHRTSTSIGSKEKKNFIRTIYNRNKMYFHAIHLEGLRLFGWYAQTMFELLFRLLTLRVDYIKSAIAFISSYQQVKRSKADLRQLCQAEGHNSSLNTIVEFIQKPVNSKSGAFFKS